MSAPLLNKLVPLGLALSGSTLTLPAADNRPNILWILTDDHRPDTLACYNRAVSGGAQGPLGPAESPTADALAKEGTLFTHFYSNAPVCAPSRASMFTGRYPFRNGVYGFEAWHGRTAFTKATIPEVLNEAGYDTMMVGKLDVRRKFDQPVHRIQAGLPFRTFIEAHLLMNTRLTEGTDMLPIHERVGTKTSRKERYFFPDGTTEDIVVRDVEGSISPEEKARREAFEKKLQIIRNAAPREDLIQGGVSTMPKDRTFQGTFNRVFKDYLDHPDQSFALWCDPKIQLEGPDTSKPLFAYIGYIWPHTPVLPPKEFRDRFKDVSYAIPEFSKEELDKLPPQLRLLYEKFGVDEMWTREQREQVIRDYFAYCAYGDWLVGQSVERFKKYSEAQGRPWVVLYTIGDHSWHLGENGIVAKFGPYNMSNRCAMIAVSSDKTAFPAGTVCNDLAEMVDIAPTIYSLAGVNPNTEAFAHLDGYPLQDVLSGEKTRAYTLNETNHAGPEHRASIRNKDFVFSMRSRPVGFHYLKKATPGENVRWGIDAPADDVEMALFDLRKDPLERNNVANDPAYRPLAEWFRAKLANIVLGDRRLEVDWTKDDEWKMSDFAHGSDDKKLAIPTSLIP